MAKRSKKKPTTKLTKFRVHYRTSDNSSPQQYDCEVVDVGAAHAAARAQVTGENVRVFIDKVKVLRGD